MPLKPASKIAAPVLALVFAVAAFAGTGQENKQPQPQAPSSVPLPDACRASVAGMSAYLLAEANEKPTGETSLTPAFNLMIYANQDDKASNAAVNLKGSWTLVGVVQVPQKDNLRSGGPEVTVPAGAVCILDGKDSGYPDQIRDEDWYQRHFLNQPQTPPQPAPK